MQHFLPEVWASLHFYFSVQEKMRHRVSIFVPEDIQRCVHKGEMVWKFPQVRDLHRTPFSTVCSIYVTQSKEGSLPSFEMFNFINY